MKALVIYESSFGNTRTIAEAVAAGLAAQLPTEVLAVGEAPDELPDGVTLLVLGGPTHAFGMSRPGTRQDAAQRAGHPGGPGGIGQREWLERARLAPEVRFATFDTRVGARWWTGSAARRADRELARLGARRLFGPVSFLVQGTPGPLVDGEVERAAGWGGQLASRHLAERATA